MATELASTDDILETYLGISSPNQQIQDTMDMIRLGIEASIKKFCRWQIVSATKTSYLPLHPSAMGVFLPSAELEFNRPFLTGTRNRLQLPSMYVTSITSIYEDQTAVGGAGGTDFAAAALLAAGTDYYLEKDQGSSASWSGGVIRVGKGWSSIPGTIKATYVSGFTESDLQNDQNDLRFAVIKECADHYVRHLRLKSQYVTGIGLGGATPDTSGLISRLHIGDFDVSFRDATANDEPNDPGSYGLSDRLRGFLQDNGYVYCGVSV